MAKPLHNAECFASHMGIWLCEPEVLKQAHAAILAGTFKPRAMEDDGGDGGDDADAFALTSDGIACISISGPMAKAAGKYTSASTVAIRQALRAAASNDAVKAIVLVIDSPGGTVAGTQALADEVAATNRIKPVIAQIEDMGASAAYWVASQASAVFANESALVGSLGTYGVVFDSSGKAAMEGVKVHVLATGPHKGAFVDGVPVTAEQLKERQAMMEDLNALFVRSVAAGRNMPDAADLFDGRVHVASKAKDLGLIDRVQTLDATLSMLANSPGRMLGGSFARSSGGESPTGNIEAISTKLPSPVIPAPEEPSMPAKSIEQVAALVKAHPAHAVLITELAAADKTEEQIVAAIADKDRQDKAAAADAALVAANAKASDLTAELAKERAEHAALKTKHDALAALKSGTEAAALVKGDPAPVVPGPKKTSADFDAMTGMERAAFLKAGGSILG